eukprot:403342681
MVGRFFDKENSFSVNQCVIGTNNQNNEEKESYDQSIKEMFINGDKLVSVKNHQYKRSNQLLQLQYQQSHSSQSSTSNQKQKSQQIYMSFQPPINNHKTNGSNHNVCRTPTGIQSRALQPIIFEQNSMKRDHRNHQLKKNHYKKLNSFNVYIPPPQVSAKCWAIFDGNKLNFIHGKREYMRREVASLTKMMTLYTVLRLIKEYRINMSSEIVTISQTASQVTGTTASLQEGDRLSVEQLLHGLMLPSGNDAAFALAQHFGEHLFNRNYGCIEEGNKVFSYQFNWHGYFVKYFLKEMNDNAYRLQMMSTNYDSPHGLMNTQNYSTAYDIAKLSAKCIHNEGGRQEELQMGKHEQITGIRWIQWNQNWHHRCCRTMPSFIILKRK